MTHDTELAQIQRLQTEVERLRQENLTLRRALTTEVHRAPREWNLTPARAEIFDMLVKRETVTANAIATQLKVTPDCVKSHVYHLRRQLAQYGVTVMSRQWRGYWLDAETRARFA